MEKYTLTFNEAINACLEGKGFIRGNEFAPGMYVDLKSGMLIVMEKGEFGYQKIRDFYINVNVSKQKYKLFHTANDRELEIVKN